MTDGETSQYSNMYASAAAYFAVASCDGQSDRVWRMSAILTCFATGFVLRFLIATDGPSAACG